MLKRYTGLCPRCGLPATSWRKVPVCQDCKECLTDDELRLWRDADDPAVAA